MRSGLQRTGHVFNRMSKEPIANPGLSA